jgi:hypothetical protein
MPSAGVELADGRDLRLDVSQSRFERRPPTRIRGPLRENMLALQIQRLSLTFAGGTVLRSRAPLIIGRKICAYFPQGICHLLLHGFTFPTTSHIFILRGICYNSSHGMKPTERIVKRKD